MTWTMASGLVSVSRSRSPRPWVTTRRSAAAKAWRPPRETREAKQTPAGPELQDYASARPCRCNVQPVSARREWQPASADQFALTLRAALCARIRLGRRHARLLKVMAGPIGQSWQLFWPTLPRRRLLLLVASKVAGILEDRVSRNGHARRPQGRRQFCTERTKLRSLALKRSAAVALLRDRLRV